MKEDNLIKIIKDTYSSILEGCKELLVVKSASGTQAEEYCLIIKKSGIEFRNKSSKGYTKMILDYKSGVIKENNRILQNGVNIIFKHLKQVSEDIKTKKTHLFKRK